MRKGLIYTFAFGGLLSASLGYCSWKIFDQSLPGDIVQGKAKAGLCMACHGADGNSTNPEWPSLAGQNRKYLHQQLIAFKAGPKGGRNNPIMYPLVANLSESDLWDLAAYYESLPAKVGRVKAKYVPLGQRIYRGGNLRTQVAACSACHGPRGLGNPLAGFPRISGQKATYVAKQLHDYKHMTRTNEPYSSIMQAIAAKMTDTEITAVAQYVSALH